VRFWIPWGIDAAVAVIVVCFFFIGLADGSVSSFNIGLWLMILSGLVGIMGGSLWLKSMGRSGLAMFLLLILAVPALLYALFLAVVLIGRPRWN